MKFVSVVFDVGGFVKNAKEYCFCAYEPLRQGDVVVVETSNGLGLARVVNPDAVPESWLRDIKDVVCAVDLTAFQARKEMAKRVAELRAKMEMRVQQLKELELFQRLADADSEMKKLLTEYNQLTEQEDK